MWGAMYVGVCMCGRVRMWLYMVSVLDEIEACWTETESAFGNC